MAGSHTAERMRGWSLEVLCSRVNEVGVGSDTAAGLQAELKRREILATQQAADA